MKWNLFVALRYYYSRRTSTVALSVFSIAVGVAALIVVISVMNGFQMGFIEDILELNSFHLRMKLNTNDDLEKLSGQIAREKNIYSVTPLHDYQTMVQSDYLGMRIIKIISIAENFYSKDKGFSSHLEILSGEFEIKNENSIVIGQQLANTLGVYVGDKIKMLDFVKSYRTGYREYIVTGIFKSGYWEYDSTLAYTKFDEIKARKNDNTITFGIKLKKHYNDQRTVSSLKSKFPDCEIISWREYNKAFFGALRMEKIVMFILIGLIFILVGVNIYNSLKRAVYEKRDEIGVLLTMGAVRKNVKNIFIYDGSVIGFTGSFFGLLSGLFISVYINEVVNVVEIVVNGIIDILGKLLSPIFNVQFSHISIFSPAEYYLDKLPSKLIFQEVLIIFLFGAFAAVIAAAKASGKVSEIEPAQIIREE